MAGARVYIAAAAPTSCLVCAPPSKNQYCSLSYDGCAYSEALMFMRAMCAGFQVFTGFSVLVLTVPFIHAGWVLKPCFTSHYNSRRKLISCVAVPSIMAQVWICSARRYGGVQTGAENRCDDLLRGLLLEGVAGARDGLAYAVGT